MLLPEQFDELKRLGLELYDYVTVAFLEEEINWIGWWEYTDPPFDLLWEFLPGAFGYKKPLSPQSLVIEPKSWGGSYESLAMRLFEAVGHQGNLKIVEENREYDPETRSGPGSTFQYRFNKTLHEHEFINYWARLNMGAAREIVEVFNSLDDGRSFYHRDCAFYYLVDSEVATSVAMKSSKAPKLHRLGD